ncbi:serine hydrolase domain-containing protein [Hungatella hathewayi]
MNINRLKQLGPLLEREVIEGRLFGNAVMVGRGQEVFYFSEHGDIKKNSPCMLCSMTKPFTSVAAWILIERGIIDPMEPVYTYLPGYKNMMVAKDGELIPANRDILIQDLLNMTSGIPSARAKQPWEAQAAESYARILKEHKHRIEDGEKIPTWQLINALGAAPLLFHPGERWNYGKNVDVVGGIIEVVSGMSLGAFFQKEIFDPLSMKDTGYTVEKKNMDKVPKIGVMENGSLKEITAQQFYGDSRELFEEPYTQSGGGGNAPIMGRGVYSTMEDCGKFASMLQQKGHLDGRRILSSQTVGMFSENNLTKEQASYLFTGLQGYGYGNFMRVMIDRTKAQSNGNNGEFGWDGAMGTYFFVDPVADIYLVYMQQREADQILRRKIRNIVYSALD